MGVVLASEVGAEGLLDKFQIAPTVGPGFGPDHMLLKDRSQWLRSKPLSYRGCEALLWSVYDRRRQESARQLLEEPLGLATRSHLDCDGHGCDEFSNLSVEHWTARL